MSTFPNSPRLLKGGPVILDAASGAVKRTIALQYNPDTMPQCLESRTVTAKGDHGESCRLIGPPKQTITLNIEIDATDQLEPVDPLARTIRTCSKLAAPFSRDWPLLFKSDQAIRTTIHQQEAVHEQRN